MERVSETKTLVRLGIRCNNGPVFISLPILSEFPFPNRKGARAVIVVTLRIPSTVRKGQVNALTLEAQPEYADTVDERSLTRRFYFSAIGEEEGGDTEPPECSVGLSTETSTAGEKATATQQCDGFGGQLCANKMWAVAVQFQVRRGE